MIRIVYINLLFSTLQLISFLVIKSFQDNDETCSSNFLNQLLFTIKYSHCVKYIATAFDFINELWFPVLGFTPIPALILNY